MSAVPGIARFQGEHAFLSNFFPAPVKYDGVTYATVEHAYQAAKTEDRVARLRIEACSTPGRAKRMGKEVKLRANWEDMKLDIMRDLLWQKFTDHPTLRERLLATGDVMLVEGNDWGDRYWGVCDGVGFNFLGRLLMFTRRVIREGGSDDALVP